MVLILVAAACSSSGKAAVRASAGVTASATNSVVGLGQAKQKVPADIAVVVVEPGTDDGSGSLEIPGPSSSSDLTPAERAAIRTRVHALGIATSAVHFDESAVSFGDGPATSVRVEIPIAGLPGIATKVATAIVGITGTSTTSGLRFAVSDCSAALTNARPAALADARRQAADLAGAAHVKLGELRAVREGSGNAIESAYLAALGSTAPCGLASTDGSSLAATYAGGSGLLPLDEKPEVQLTFSVSASYALSGPVARTMTEPVRATPRDLPIAPTSSS